MIYYKTVRSPSTPTTKSFFGNISLKAKLFLPVLFLVLFLLPQFVQAQQSTTTGIDQFICLFEKADINGKCPNPQPNPDDIKMGTASGVLYGRTDLFTPAGTSGSTGIRALTMQIGLWADEKNEDRETRYYYSRVGDTRGTSFFVRLTYTPTGTTTPVYKFINIPYVKTDWSRPAGDILKILPKTNSIKIPRTGGGNDQVGIAFYHDGTNGKEFVKQQVVLVESPLYDGDQIIPYGTNVVADFWYCGGQKRGRATVDGRYGQRDGDRIEYFTTSGTYLDENGNIQNGLKSEDRCEKQAAYKIGKSFQFSLPKDPAAAELESKQELESGITGTSYLGSTLPQCSIDPVTNGSVMGCVAQILYHGVFRPVAFFAQLMGKLFDFFLGYSLSDESYRHNFVQTGWQLVRDISNIFFIIIMIWTGLMAVFNTSNVSYKKVIPTLIINALIINFSLFATRVVIDISNITARIFYNQMVVKIDGDETNLGPGGYKTISASIVSSFNPQKIFRGSVLADEVGSDGNIKESNDGGGSGNFNGQESNPTTGAKFNRYSREYAAYFALVTLVAIAISFSVAMMFWKTAFMFVGRVIGLYVAMIFSPFAFLSRGNVPLVSKIQGVSYDSWWKDLTQYSLLAPIFVFFLYIINSFLNVEFVSKLGLDQNATDFFSSVMYVMIPMLIIYGLVTKAVGIAKRYSGYFGDMAQNFAVKATGVVGGAAIGLASGGLAYAGTRFGSSIGRALGQSTIGRRAAVAIARAQSNGTRASLAARLTNRALNWTQSSSWDPRNTKLGGVLRDNYLFKQMGIKTKDDLTGQAGLGQKDFEGGYIAQQEKRQKELREEIENIKFSYLNDEQSKKLWKEIADAKVGNSAMKDYLNKTDTGFKATSDQETQLKKEVKDAKKKIDDLEADIRTANKLSEGDMEKAKSNLNNEKRSLSEKESKILDIQKIQLQTIKDIEADKNKLNTIRETDEYKKSWKEKTEELKKTYGKVESTKDLANAMRRDYAETLRNNSFWMKDGKQRKGLWAWGALGGGSIGAMISGGVSAAFGAIASEQIKFEQEALDAVTKKYIKDYSKGKGKTSKIDQYRNQLDELNDKIKEVIAAKLGGLAKDINLDDHDIKDQKEWVKEHVENLRAAFDTRDAEFKDATDVYRKSQKTKADQDAYAVASKARKKADDLLKAAENLWKTKSETETNISKEEDKERENK